MDGLDLSTLQQTEPPRRGSGSVIIHGAEFVYEPR